MASHYASKPRQGKQRERCQSVPRLRFASLGRTTAEVGEASHTKAFGSFPQLLPLFAEQESAAHAARHALKPSGHRRINESSSSDCHWRDLLGRPTAILYGSSVVVSRPPHLRLHKLVPPSRSEFAFAASQQHCLRLFPQILCCRPAPRCVSFVFQGDSRRRPSSATAIPPRTASLSGINDWNAVSVAFRQRRERAR
jgi:hypothetical protein